MITAKKALIFLSFSLIFLASASEAHAIFDLTVSPRRGGNNIRFEAGRPGELLRNEEVTLTLTSTLASQYRIYQTVYQPLTNEFGNTIPQDAFIVFSPSSPLGTLRTQQETSIAMGQMPIFTSNAAGDSDEFVLVFNVRVPENQAGGVYHTQITFTAEPVAGQSGISPSVRTLDVRVELTPSFNVTIENVSGGRDLNLGKITQDRPTAEGALKIEIESNIGTTYTLVQQASEPLASQEGELFDEESIRFSAAGGSNGSLSIGGTPANLPSSPTLIYTSSSSGAGDVLQLQYQTVEGIKQKAGLYSGVMTFKIESNSPLVPGQVFNVPVKIEIEPILYLEVKMDQGGSFNFGTFRTGEEKQERKATLVVHSNLGEPYQVSQILSRKLTNSEGAAIPKEHFQFFGSDAQTGTLTVMSPAPVEEGSRVVFTSDPKGTPEQFTLNYSLTIPRDTRAGSYNAETVYSITTL